MYKVIANATLVQGSYDNPDFQQSLVTTREPSPCVIMLLRQQVLRDGSALVTGVDRWRHAHGRPLLSRGEPSDQIVPVLQF